jgi:hypothetical protein
MSVASPSTYHNVYVIRGQDLVKKLSHKPPNHCTIASLEACEAVVWHRNVPITNYYPWICASPCKVEKDQEKTIKNR